MESYIAEMKEFVQSIRDNTSPPVTGIDGRIPVVIGMAAKKSYLEYRPVRLRVVFLFETFSGNQNVSINSVSKMKYLCHNKSSTLEAIYHSPPVQ
jgi:hypothetical protein